MNQPFALQGGYVEDVYVCQGSHDYSSLIPCLLVLSQIGCRDGKFSLRPMDRPHMVLVKPKYSNKVSRLILIPSVQTLDKWNTLMKLLYITICLCVTVVIMS